MKRNMIRNLTQKFKQLRRDFWRGHSDFREVSSEESSPFMEFRDGTNTDVTVEMPSLIDPTVGHVDLLNKLMASLDSNVDKLQRLQRNYLLPSFDSKREQLGWEAIKSLTETLNRSFDAGRKAVAKTDKICTNNRMVMGIKQKFNLQLQDLYRKFKHNSDEFSRANETQRNRGKIVAPQLYHSAVSEFPSQSQMLLMVDDQAELVQQREREMTELARSVTEISEMFKDVSLMVNEQQTLIDNIECNIEETVIKVEEAEKELKQAEKYNKSSRCKIAIILFIVLGIITIVTLIGLKASNTI